jgi:hypothetical protein
MTAFHRSNVLIRQEKALGSITVPRLLLAGGGAAAVALLLSRTLGLLGGCAGAGLLGAFLLILTHPVEGRPLFRLALRSASGLAALAALRGQTSGIAGLLARLFRVRPGDATLASSAEFGAGSEAADAELPEPGWEYLGGFKDAARPGLAVVDSPFAARSRAEKE